jgi:hypothetical protein
MATGRPFDLPYSVEQWDDTDSHVEELIALTGRMRKQSSEGRDGSKLKVPTEDSGSYDFLRGHYEQPTRALLTRSVWIQLAI